MAEKIKILVGDKLAPEGLEYLRGYADVVVDVKTGLSEEELGKIVGEYDGLIVRSGVQVTAKVLSEPGRLKGIARAGVGVDNIDLEAATSKGVLVMNSAEASTITTAEHAFALLMAMARNIGPAYKKMTEGGWDRNTFTGRQLSGLTLGVIGFGRIGRTVAERALAFGMTVVAFDPVFNAATALEGRVKMVKSFDEMLDEVDVMSFHVPLNDHTRNMLNAERFGKCKKGVMVVNAARGGVIDNDALLAAVESGQCGGAALDVYESEPLEADSPLRKQPKILLTPHLGASTVEAQQAVSTGACVQMLEFLRGQGVRGAVNLGGVRLDLSPQQQGYVDLVQRMARLIGPMCEKGISGVTARVYGTELNGVAGTIERMALIELLKTHLDEPVNVVNVNLYADQRGIAQKTVLEEATGRGSRLCLEVLSGEKKRRIVGTIYEDGQPRVLEINGYHMDMVPAGQMMVLLNEDRPGMVGMVGSALAEGKINIADMAISRRGETAMMVLKLDQAPGEKVMNPLRHRPGILKVAVVKLAELEVEEESE